MTDTPSSAVIIVDGDRVEVVGPDGVARALTGTPPPGLGWPGDGGRGAPSPDALALGGVAPPAADHADPSGPHDVLRSDGGVAFVLYLAIGFASTLACIAALVGAFYVSRALTARRAVDAAEARDAGRAAAAAAEEEARPPPKPTVVVVHPGGAAVGVGVEEACVAGTGDDGGAAAAATCGWGGAGEAGAPVKAPLPLASPGKATPLAATSSKGALSSSPAALAVAALPLDLLAGAGAGAGEEAGCAGACEAPTPDLIPARRARPQSPGAAAVAALMSAMSAAAAAAAGVVGGEGGSQPPQPPAAPSSSSSAVMRRLRGLLLARAPSPAPPAIPGLGEP